MKNCLICEKALGCDSKAAFALCSECGKTLVDEVGTEPTSSALVKWVAKRVREHERTLVERAERAARRAAHGAKCGGRNLCDRCLDAGMDPTTREPKCSPDCSSLCFVCCPDD